MVKPKRELKVGKGSNYADELIKKNMEAIINNELRPVPMNLLTKEDMKDYSTCDVRGEFIPQTNISMVKPCDFDVVYQTGVMIACPNEVYKRCPYR